VHGVSKVDKIKKRITQFGSKSRDESFKPSMISLKCYSNPHVLITASCANDDLIRLKRFVSRFFRRAV
jgi:hypothetical protein